MTLNRRGFLLGGGAAAGLAACRRSNAPGDTAATSWAWKMATSWPRDFPGLGEGANRLGERITRASGGRLSVTVYGGNDLVPAFEVFDAVSRGTVQMGHCASYYWRSKSEAAPFFCAVPFGLNAQEMNGWLYRGGGLELWRELYAKFKLVPFPAGNTGVQMAGWFNREITSVRDLQGLKMRIPGLGGEVMQRLGAVPVNVPGGEIFQALQSHAIDACEWVGPWNDSALDLHKVAKYCYYPGWQEPGPTLEAIINADAWAELPDDLKAIVESCCQATNDDMLAEFTVENQRALQRLTTEHKVEFRRLPDRVLQALRETSTRLLEEIAARDAFARRVYDSFKTYREAARAWHAVSEVAFYQART